MNKVSTYFNNLLRKFRKPEPLAPAPDSAELAELKASTAKLEAELKAYKAKAQVQRPEAAPTSEKPKEAEEFIYVNPFDDPAWAVTEGAFTREKTAAMEQIKQLRALLRGIKLLPEAHETSYAHVTGGSQVLKYLAQLAGVAADLENAVKDRYAISPTHKEFVVRGRKVRDQMNPGKKFKQVRTLFSFGYPPHYYKTEAEKAILEKTYQEQAELPEVLGEDNIVQIKDFVIPSRVVDFSRVPVKKEPTAYAHPPKGVGDVVQPPFEGSLRSRTRRKNFTNSELATYLG
jgi:hypothetical protein